MPMYGAACWARIPWSGSQISKLAELLGVCACSNPRPRVSFVLQGLSNLCTNCVTVNHCELPPFHTCSASTLTCSPCTRRCPAPFLPEFCMHIAFKHVRTFRATCVVNLDVRPGWFTRSVHLRFTYAGTWRFCLPTLLLSQHSCTPHINRRSVTTPGFRSLHICAHCSPFHKRSTSHSTPVYVLHHAL